MIATTSQMLTTGVDVPTCKNVAIVRNIGSMTEFKQIIGRGTRVRDEYGKLYFNILDDTPRDLHRHPICILRNRPGRRSADSCKHRPVADHESGAFRRFGSGGRWVMVPPNLTESLFLAPSRWLCGRYTFHAQPLSHFNGYNLSHP